MYPTEFQVLFWQNDLKLFTLLGWVNWTISAHFLVFMNGAVAMYQMNLKLVVNCKINQGAHVETDLSAVCSGAIRIIL